MHFLHRYPFFLFAGTFVLVPEDEYVQVDSEGNGNKCAREPIHITRNTGPLSTGGKYTLARDGCECMLAVNGQWPGDRGSPLRRRIRKLN